MPDRKSTCPDPPRRKVPMSRLSCVQNFSCVQCSISRLNLIWYTFVKTYVIWLDSPRHRWADDTLEDSLVSVDVCGDPFLPNLLNSFIQTLDRLRDKVHCQHKSRLHFLRQSEKVPLSSIKLYLFLPVQVRRKKNKNFTCGKIKNADEMWFIKDLVCCIDNHRYVNQVNCQLNVSPEKNSE